MSILQMWRLRPTDGKSGHPPFRPIRHRLPSRWPVFHLAVQTRYSPSNKRILFFTIPFAPAKIEYFSDFFRKIAYIKVLYHLCTPIYGDIEYLCGLVCKGVHKNPLIVSNLSLLLAVPRRRAKPLKALII